MLERRNRPKTSVNAVLGGSLGVKPQGDIFQMFDEVRRERDSVTREKEHIVFLHKMLSGASRSLDVESILARAEDNLNLLFPVSELLAVFWSQDASGPGEADVFLRSGLAPADRDSRVQYLLDAAAKVQGSPVASYRVSPMVQQEARRPLRFQRHDQPGRSLLVALKAGQGTFGLLSAVIHDQPGKELLTTARTALRQISVPLANALLFRQVKAQADFDGLTQLHNRRSFDLRLAEEVRRHRRTGQPLSLLLLDLDHFKSINDTHGHQAGDRVLKDTAQVLRDTLRTTDFAARYGGEEFVAILPETREEDAWKLAERLRTRIAKTEFSFGTTVIRGTVSIGLTSLDPGAPGDEAELLHQADEALYEAKRSGRNKVCLSLNTEIEVASEEQSRFGA